jgi:hypothetical protein
MSDYRVADGFNIAYASMTVLSPQPSSAGIQATRQSFAADGTPINEGLFVEFVWNVLGTKSQFQSILSNFGLFNATNNLVTVYIRDDVFDYVRMNGRAIQPLPENGVQWRRPFIRNFTILVRDLEPVS